MILPWAIPRIDDPDVIMQAPCEREREKESEREEKKEKRKKANTQRAQLHN